MLRLPVLSAYVFFCTVAVFLTGCSPASTLKKTDHVITPSHQRITAIGGLHKKLVFAPPRIKRDVGEPLNVDVPVRATTQDDLKVQYRFRFFDDLNVPILPGMSWRHMILPAGARRYMDATATEATASDWEMVVRPAE